MNKRKGIEDLSVELDCACAALNCIAEAAVGNGGFDRVSDEVLEEAIIGISEYIGRINADLSAHLEAPAADADRLDAGEKGVISNDTPGAQQ